jgi:hypothetical protein
LPSFKRKGKYKNPDKVIYLRCMVQSILDIIGALRELRLKLETLQIKFLERTTLSPCLEELKDFKHMHERIVQHGETFKQLDPEAFKKLSDISSIYYQLEELCRIEDFTSLSRIVRKLGDHLGPWRAAVESLILALEFRIYPGYVVNSINKLLRAALQLSLKGDAEGVYEKLSVVHGYLNRLVKFHEGCSEYLKGEFSKIQEEIGAYKELVKSGELDPCSLKLKELIDGWLSRVNILASELQPCSPRTSQSLSLPVKEGIEITCEYRSFAVDFSSIAGKALILGRYDPGGLDEYVGSLPDSLKVQEYSDKPGRILYLFTNVQCRWKCLTGEENCTLEHHLLLVPDSSRKTVRILPFPGASVSYATDIRETLKHLTGELELEPGQRVYLWISGVQDIVQDRWVPVTVRLVSSLEANPHDY